MPIIPLVIIQFSHETLQMENNPSLYSTADLFLPFKSLSEHKQAQQAKSVAKRLFDFFLARNQIFLSEARWEEINWTEKRRSKDCSEGYFISTACQLIHCMKNNVLHTKQETSKVLLRKSHGYWPLLFHC